MHARMALLIDRMQAVKILAERSAFAARSMIENGCEQLSKEESEVNTLSTMTTNDVNYFTHLTLGDTYGRVFHIYGQRWLGFVSIALLVYFAGWICSLILSVMMGGDLSIEGFSINVHYIKYLNTTSKTFFYCLECFVYYVFSCIAHGASIWFVVHLYKKQQPNIKGAFIRAFEKKITLVLATVFIFLLAFLPMFLIMQLIIRTGSYGAFVASGVVSFIWAAVVDVLTYVVYPAIMVENLEVRDSLVRSWTLTEGHRLQILGIVLLWSAVKLVLSLIVAAITFHGFPYTQNMPVFYLARILDTAFGIFLLSIGSVFEGVVYINLRVVKEMLTSDKLGQEIGLGEDNYVMVTPSTNQSERNGKDGVMA